MIKTHLSSAWRNLTSNKFYTGINIIGLAIGLCAGIFILIWVQEELNYNNFTPNSENIFRVNSNIGAGTNRQTWSVTPGPLASFAKKETPGVVQAVRVKPNWNYSVLSVGTTDYNIERNALVDPAFFAMFELKMLQGNPKKPFPADNTVILSESIANKYFGEADPMGQTLKADYDEVFTVVGVVEDVPENSSVNFKVFFPLSLYERNYTSSSYWSSIDSDWGNFNYVTYLELSGGVSVEEITEHLAQINAANDPNARANIEGQAYRLQAFSKLNLYKPDNSPRNIHTVRIFVITAILILLIASINYVNLTTARSLKRAREVGIRKIIGADKKHLFFQFITETFLSFLLAFLMAFALIYLLMPIFSQLSGKDIHFSILDASFWKVTLLVFSGTLLASSIYPALILSSFQPLQAIKGTALPGMGAASLRKVLVTLQFIFSVVLIIGTLVIGKQLKFLQSVDPGYDRSQVITFFANEEIYEHGLAIKSEIENLPGVEGVALASNSLVNNVNTTADTDWDTKDPERNLVVTPLGIDENFIPLMKMQLNAGKNFKGTKADSRHYILNETAVRMTGIKDPIGKRFSLWENEGTIIGVVKDFHFESLKSKIGPSVIYYDPTAYQVYVKTSSDMLSSTLVALEGLWKKYSPGFPFHYNFLDETFERLYLSDQRTAKLFNVFSVLAIFISCLGLLGLVTHTTQMRTREIGIRKVLGASVFQITRLLAKDFLLLVIISSIIAVPLAWYFMSSWLESFVYRIEMTWLIFALAGFLVLLIALATVSLQAIRAAIANPIKSLRTE